MRIYLAYKQTGIPLETLKKELNFLKNILEQNGKNKVFIYFFEGKNDLPPAKLNKRFLEKINKSDIVIGYVNYPDKSEGQLLELGMAYALNKKIILLVNKKVKTNYYLIYGLGKVIEFSNLEELKNKKLLE